MRDRATYHCERCLQPFKSETLLARHRDACYQDKPETIVPPEQSTHSFTAIQNTQKLPYVVYADIECRIERNDVNADEQSMSVAGKRRHKPIAFGFLVVAHSGMKERPLDIPYKQFVGDDCVERGMYELERVTREIADWVRVYGDQKVSLSPEQARQHVRASTCYVCSCKFSPESIKHKKVVEHDHLTGEYRGAACQACNNKMRLNRYFVPVYFHNFKNYDCHAICVESLGKMKNWDVAVIPTTKEKYISVIGKYELSDPLFARHGGRRQYMSVVFRDSFQFMTFSLDSLVKNLDIRQLEYSQRVVPTESMASSKGVFPYSYLDSVERLAEQNLPPREAFFDDLTQEECPIERYERAQEAWGVIGCRTFEDYLLFYLRLDVHQLADVFEAFRGICLREDGLEPSYYATLPGMTWDSAFKMTNATVQLLHDVDMYEFFERGIRGGMTFVNTHFMSAVNARDTSSVNDSTTDRQDILYIDANNLYGHALSQKLPQSEFKWMSDQEIDSVDIGMYDYEGSDVGHVFEVDLEYPRDIHDSTIDLPLCPEKVTICSEMLSELMHDQWKSICISRYLKENKKFNGCVKLLLNQWGKDRYVVHGRVLQFYLNMGMRLVRVHRAVSFKQAAFFEPYIRYNSERRQQATNAFEKDYYKLKNNSLFGKTMENVRRRMNLRLCNNSEHLVTLASRPSYRHRYIFSEDLVGVHMSKEKVVLNKPVYIGQAVLDLSKLEMYELRYNTLARYEAQFPGGSIRIMGGDTDSFFLSLKNVCANSLLEKMARDDVLDSSNYPKDHPLYSDRNRARLGCVKDETAGRAAKEIIMLRPKAYSIIYADSSAASEGIRRAKGVQRAVLRNKIRHDDYVRAWRESTETRHTQRRIGSQLHQLYTYTYSKRTLSYFEDKRYWTADNESLPYGHHSIGKDRPIANRVFYAPAALPNSTD